MGARVLGVPEPELVDWMRRAETIIKPDSRIAFRFYTPRDVFLDFLVNARAAGMNCMPDPANDHALVDTMMIDEVLLLGGNPSMDYLGRPNVVLIELIRSFVGYWWIGPDPSIYALDPPCDVAHLTCLELQAGLDYVEVHGSV